MLPVPRIGMCWKQVFTWILSELIEDKAVKFRHLLAIMTDSAVDTFSLTRLRSTIALNCSPVTR